MSETTHSFRELRATDHSLHLLGRVNVIDSEVMFREERPLEGDIDESYVFANGLFGTMETMALPRCVAASAGYNARALGAQHNRGNSAIGYYAQEIAAVASVDINEAPSRAIHLAGVSMGGAGVIKAAAICDNVVSVTAEAPACVSDTSVFLDTLLGAPKRLQEVVQLVRDEPAFALRAVMCSIANTPRRLRGLYGEIFDLATMKLAEDVAIIRSKPNPPHIRILVSDKDGMITKRGLVQGANRLGVEVIVVPDSAHVHGVLTGKAYTQRIIDMNRDLAA